ncbi:MFS transporter [Emticicia sp. CRIBPO]|uniref:MFS transporter n=1 Tax=Emticicia sp. CRIBPO TaxID=2683258 RepID=UPI001412150F|nr:MFS transporter [Emticicia sp. CRIBPO]NBA88750.1 MFS transporter [Emticicia sp. CRIBPO]
MTKDPYAALRYPEFRYFISAQFLFTIAILIQEVVISFYLYEITHDPFALGLVGLFEAIPFISLALFGGHLADKYDRKLIYQICFVVVIFVTVLLIISVNPGFGLHLKTSQQPPFIYLCVFIFGVARGFYHPAWSSLKPFLVKPEHFSNSATWSSQFWQAGLIIGPTTAGFFYAYLGLVNTLYAVLIMLVLTLIIASLIARKPVENQLKAKLSESLKEGIGFVMNNKIMLYAIVLDMFSVLFGGVIAILPVFAKDILYVGPEGLGMLRAAPGAGAVLTMFAAAYFPPTDKAWRNMLLAVAGFGVATLVFALSSHFIISVVALFFTGAFDSISVVIRQTILQVLPPDNMRGRVSSVNSIFVSTSNELGAFESGVAAKLLGTVNSVVFGGAMTLLVVGYIYSQSKGLFSIKLVRKAS